MTRAYLLGYGKMGKKIHSLAESVGVKICGHSSNTNDAMSDPKLAMADVIIEFSRPDVALNNIVGVLRLQKPIVCGTTGWLDDLEEIRQLLEDTRGKMFYASNFSFGANVMFYLNRKLARIMNQSDDHKVRMLEIHHLEKKDKPSGTAATLAEDIIKEHDSYDSWTLDATSQDKTIHIDCLREANVKGTHEVIYSSPIDEIVIRHEAFSRDGFALGALEAAKWLVVQKSGWYGMQDLLGLE